MPGKKKNKSVGKKILVVHDGDKVLICRSEINWDEENYTYIGDNTRNAEAIFPEKLL